jgi:8-amino-7-oxononanoate synthase
LLENDALRVGCRTLVDVLEYRASTSADHTAYRFLSSSGDEEGVLTYARLRERVARMASRIAEIAAPGDRVVLLLPPGLDYVTALFACQYAGVVAVPAYPPNPRRPDARVAGIVADCGARLAIVSSTLHHRLTQFIASSPTLAHIAWVDVEDMLDPTAPELIRPAPAGGLAILQYTSGSTGDPRGVMLPHSSVMHNLAVIHRVFRQREGDEAVFWVPPYHDMGLIGAILQPLYAKFPVNLMAPSTFSQRPIRWLEAMSKYRATTSGAPNFAYDLCAERVTDDERAALDLSRWRIVINGAEPVRADTMNRFVAAFEPHGFRRKCFMPCYGLAEVTLFAAAARGLSAPTVLRVDRASLAQRTLQHSEREDAASLVTVGPPSDMLTVRIVDPGTNVECAPDKVGEIWIAGGSVASGYWGRDAESAEVFGARLAGSTEAFLRTGDLGAIHEGELVVTGRLKDLVIVAGRNFYPQDIENAAEHGHPHIRGGAVAAFSIGSSGREHVVIVAEVARHHRTSANALVVGAVRTSVANALGVTIDDVVLIRQGTLPKTSSGKLQRRRTRDLYESGDITMLAVEPPVNARAIGSPRVTSSAEVGVALRSWLREYARHHLDSVGMNERREMRQEVTRDFAEQGLFGLDTLVELGGLGLAQVDVLRVVEQLASIDLTLATYVGGHNSLGVRPIVQHGQAALRASLVPALARGERIGALALSEPAAGSNPWAIETVALPVDGGWQLHGVKSWIGSAATAGVFTVIARIPGDDGGITAFVVRAGLPGLRIGEAAATLGMRGMWQNAVHLEGVFVGPEAVLGGVGQGMLVVQDTLLHARFGVAAMSLGALKRAMQLSHRYAARRKVSSGRLMDHPATRARIGGMAASAAALDTYLAVLAEAMDAGVALPEDAFIVCKTAGPELLWEAVDGTMQLLGGRGYVESNPAAQLFRDARLLRIFEGPTEPLLVHLGTRAMRDASAQRLLVADRLGAPDIADQLARVATQVAARLSAHGATRAAANQWASLLLGGAVTEGVMLASARIARARGTSGCDLAIARFEERFEAALGRCSTAHADERAALLGQNLESAVEWANNAVGDVEQRSNERIDPLLDVEWVEAAPRQPKPLAARPAGEIVHSPSLVYILDWLSEEFQLAPGAASAETSLRDHGLDSLAATRLVVALESHLGRRIDASLLWRSATIGEFASAVDGVRGDDATLPTLTVPHDVHPDALPVSQWPEFRALKGRLAEVIAGDSVSPYFTVHEGISGATATVDGRELINFSNYNYLGLSGHPDVTLAAQRAAEQYGTSVSASRVVSGERPVNGELEAALAGFVGADAALVFVGGHATNVAVLSHLFGPGDLVLCDALIHNSALQGAAFSGARWVTFPHNDWAACDAMLAEMRHRHRRAIVVIEGVYSADGDVPDLARFVDVKARHGTMLMVDEAHSLGVLGATGRGIAEAAGINPGSIDILMGTLSKTLASCGGYIAGSRELVEYLKYTAPGFVYSVGITPPNAAAALASLRVLEAEPWRVTRVRENARRFAQYAQEAGLDTGKSGGAGVVPVIVGDSARAVRISQALFAAGVNASPMISPAVPNDEARLRFFVSSEHTEAQLRAAVSAMATAVAHEIAQDPVAPTSAAGHRRG